MQSYLVHDANRWYAVDKYPTQPPPAGWRRVQTKTQWQAMQESRCYRYYPWVYSEE